MAEISTGKLQMEIGCYCPTQLEATGTEENLFVPAGLMLMKYGEASTPSIPLCFTPN